MIPRRRQEKSGQSRCKRSLFQTAPDCPRLPARHHLRTQKNASQDTAWLAFSGALKDA